MAPCLIINFKIKLHCFYYNINFTPKFDFYPKLAIFFCGKSVLLNSTHSNKNQVEYANLRELTEDLL
ncbi:hypothetical protein QV08_05530 [Gallibacterium salpingitidis]|uniref:Uncharacterized protein n=1 Tax=Gallibacterium salpingitidis TaxID=505341 RepID=A0AB36E6J0_9PAST|nr:hypothetical protein QV08_05530 [Gallibacterium salpingitidis]OBX11728.1 hypothetical protein QV09_01435 [Gallibacterium salpingitidis]